MLVYGLQNIKKVTAPKERFNARYAKSEAEINKYFDNLLAWYKANPEAAKANEEKRYNRNNPEYDDYDAPYDDPEYGDPGWTGTSLEQNIAYRRRMSIEEFREEQHRQEVARHHERMYEIYGD